MSCYAECISKENATSETRRLLLRFSDKHERAYIVAAFAATALACERIRTLTREEARRDYDIDRFGRIPYATELFLADPNRPGSNIIIEAIEPTSVFAARQARWHGGVGTQGTLFCEGE